MSRMKLAFCLIACTLTIVWQNCTSPSNENSRKSCWRMSNDGVLTVESNILPEQFGSRAKPVDSLSTSRFLEGYIYVISSSLPQVQPKEGCLDTNSMYTATLSILLSDYFSDTHEFANQVVLTSEEAICPLVGSHNKSIISSEALREWHKHLPALLNELQASGEELGVSNLIISMDYGHYRTIDTISPNMYLYQFIEDVCSPVITFVPQ